jgi:hypothetical protein
MSETPKPGDTGLAALLPAVIEITVGGRPLTIRPAPFRHTLQMLAVAGPILEDFTKEGVDAELNADLVMRLMTRHAEAIAPLCAIASGQDQAWVDALDREDGVKLFSAVLRANADFFLKAVTQVLLTIVSRRLGKSSSSDPMKDSPPSPSLGPASPAS